MATKPKEVSKSTEVATTAGFAMTEVPAYIKQDSARGSEEVGTKDLVIPRLEIVQSQGAAKDAGIPEGNLYNSATMENLGDVVHFVPVYFRAEYLVWKDNDEGGGFFGAFNTLSEAEARRMEVVEGGENPDFIEVVDTPVHYGLLVSPDGEFKPQQIVISMAKSKAKISRKWNAMIQIVGGDRFARVYRISTFVDVNKQNKKFGNFVVVPAGYVPEDIYRLAEKTYEVFKGGSVRAGHEQVLDPEDSGTIDRSGV